MTTATSYVGATCELLTDDMTVAPVSSTNKYIKSSTGGGTTVSYYAWPAGSSTLQPTQLDNSGIPILLGGTTTKRDFIDLKIFKFDFTWQPYLNTLNQRTMTNKMNLNTASGGRLVNLAGGGTGTDITFTFGPPGASVAVQTTNDAPEVSFNIPLLDRTNSNYENKGFWLVNRADETSKNARTFLCFDANKALTAKNLWADDVRPNDLSLFRFVRAGRTDGSTEITKRGLTLGFHKRTISSTEETGNVELITAPLFETIGDDVVINLAIGSGAVQTWKVLTSAPIDYGEGETVMFRHKNLKATPTSGVAAFLYFDSNALRGFGLDEYFNRQDPFKEIQFLMSKLPVPTSGGDQKYILNIRESTTSVGGMTTGFSNVSVNNSGQLSYSKANSGSTTVLQANAPVDNGWILDKDANSNIRLKWVTPAPGSVTYYLNVPDNADTTSTFGMVGTPVNYNLKCVYCSTATSGGTCAVEGLTYDQYLQNSQPGKTAPTPLV